MTGNSSNIPLKTLFLLAWRNLWRHTKRTVITLTMIAIGFGLTVFSIGLQDSGHHSMVKNAINMGDGHITLQHKDYLDSPANYRFIDNGEEILQKVRSLDIPAQVVPRIALQVLASTANNSVGAAVQGINVSNDPLVTLLDKNMLEGDWPDAGDDRGLVIGAGMAKKLKVKLGSKIVLMSGTQSGNTEAQLGRVRGIFQSGIAELDNYLVLTDLSYATRFLVAEGANKTTGPVTRIAIFLDQEKSLPHWKNELKQTLNSPNVAILDWQEIMPQLVQYIVIDDMGAYIMMVFILLVIVFGIVNTVLMGVLERTREFGLLRALGMQRKYLVSLIFCETVLLSFLAVVCGWTIGGAIHMYVARYGIDFSGMIPEGTTFAGTFMDPVIYSELSIDRIIQLTLVVFLTTLASGIYPAIKASRVTPVEALRT